MDKIDETLNKLQEQVKNFDANKLPPLGHPVADMVKNMAVEKLKEVDLKKAIQDVKKVGDFINQ